MGSFGRRKGGVHPRTRGGPARVNLLFTAYGEPRILPIKVILGTWNYGSERKRGLTGAPACGILGVMTYEDLEVENGDNDSLGSVESAPVAEQGSGVGSEVTKQPGSNGTSGTQKPDQVLLGAESPDEWDTYVESQERNGWLDISVDEIAFCDEYLQNGYKHREAALVCEWNPAKGIRLVNKPLLRAYIAHQEDKKRLRSIVTERFLDAQLMELYDQAIGEVPVAIVTANGGEMTACKFNGALALSIIQERSKTAGVTEEDKGKNGPLVHVSINMADLLGHTKPVIIDP